MLYSLQSFVCLLHSAVTDICFESSLSCLNHIQYVTMYNRWFAQFSLTHKLKKTKNVLVGSESHLCYIYKVLRLEKKNDGVKDDKSGDDDTREVR